MYSIKKSQDRISVHLRHPLTLSLKREIVIITMKEKMSRWGVGPVFAVVSAGYGAFILAMSLYFYPAFRIPVVPQWLLTALGAVLLCAGVPFYIIATITVMKAYNADRLVTRGIYRCCRHPLYSAWVVFIVPGIFLLANSWIGLTVPAWMYLVLCKLVAREEVYLQEVFGSHYTDYKSKTPCILPLGCLKRL